jgi:hypothetical protein
VKVIRSTKDRLVFHLGRREQQLLLAVLKLYPCIPPAHQPLSKSAGLPDPEASQQLLDEALAEQRTESKRQLQALLSDTQRLQEHPDGWRLSLSASEVEWLLQVLNDIRVGSWVSLGSPEKKLGKLTKTTAPRLWAMEMAGFFQMDLLHAIEGDA